MNPRRWAGKLRSRLRWIVGARWDRWFPGEPWNGEHDPAVAAVPVWRGESDGRFLHDWLGTRVDPGVRDAWRPDPPGPVEKPRPRPSATYAELAFVLRAVTSPSRLPGTRTVLELGAGFGPWLLTIESACRRVGGPSYRLVGVEAHPERVRWMKEHFAHQSIEPERTEAIHAGVGARPGRAWFTPAAGFGAAYGESLSERPTGRDGEAEVPVLGFVDLIRRVSPVELIHADVQGAEADIFDTPALDAMSETVARVGIATHSRAIGRTLHARFEAAGWRIVQSWRQRCREHTPWGSIRFEDGWLAAENPRWT